MKKILLFLLCMLFIPVSAHALEIKKTATPKLPVVLIDNTDHITGKINITSPTVYYVVQDGAAVQKTTPTFGELDATNMKGLYQLTLDATMTGTVGKLVVYVTKAGCDDFRAEVDIVDNIESDSYTKVSGLTFTTANQVDARVLTNSDKTGYTASTVSDKTGYALTQAFPTNFSALSISATTGLVDITQTAADKVWGTTARVLTAGTNISLAKGTGVTGFNDITAANVWQTDLSGYSTAGYAGTYLKNSSPSGIADAVWDELGAGHTTVGSFAEWLNGVKDSNGNYSGIETLIRINR
jgi:hypothetical protein